jgi:hypothetical protein
MATFQGQTVDIYEDFEDATLATGLTETDVDGILTINSSGRYYAGSYSMALDCTTGNHTARIVYTLASSGNISFGFWYFTANWTSNGKEISVTNVYSGGVGHKAISLWDDQTWAGVRNISFTEMGAGIAISSATWYWITCKWEAGVGGTLRIYDTSYNQVGSDLTTTGSGGDYHGDSADGLNIGFDGNEWSNFAGTINFDEYVIDETSMLWPILGWTAGTSLAGSVTGVSVIASFQPYIYRTMINDVVSAQSVVASTQPYIYHTLVNDVVAAQSNVPTVLPYVYHTLINNVVTGLSNIPTLLPYVYHILVNSVVTGLSNVPTLLPYIYHTLVNSVVTGVSTLFGNLSLLGAQVYQALTGIVDGVSVVTGNIYEYLFVNAIPSAVSALIGNLSVLGSTIGSKLRIYMRIGGGKF